MSDRPLGSDAGSQPVHRSTQVHSETWRLWSAAPEPHVKLVMFLVVTLSDPEPAQYQVQPGVSGVAAQVPEVFSLFSLTDI